jgi:hypothetical protein
MVECPECGNEYKSLGGHWRFSPSHRPELTQKQLETTTGVLMGDGSVGEGKENSYLSCNMISPNYLKYLNNIFGCLSNGVSLIKTAAENAKYNREGGFVPDAKKENYSDQYKISTVCHPKFNEFREWYSSGEKIWPEDIELTPTVLKHWYVGDGHYEKERNRLSIAMDNEIENTEKVSQYFTNVGLPEPSNFKKVKRAYGHSCTVRWAVNDTSKLFNYMGKPLPDFEYKWPEEYR